MRLKHISKNILTAMVLLAAVSCYDDYAGDLEYSIGYFTFQYPLRTVVAERDMDIRVGISIGGRREVDKKDWARFSIDGSYLDGTGLTLMPSNYYTLENSDRMSISNPNLPIADVGVSFTDDFYNDPLSHTLHYALPFHIEDSSLDSLNRGEFDPYGNELSPPKDYTIVAVKYISAYHGTYYVKGNMSYIDGEGNNATINYSQKDLSANITRDVNTLGLHVIRREGLGNLAVPNNRLQAVKITVDESTQPFSVAIEAPDGCVAISDATATFSGTKAEPEFTLNYTFTAGGVTYTATETLIRRQDPEKDLRWEEWN